MGNYHSKIDENMADAEMKVCKKATCSKQGQLQSINNFQLVIRDGLTFRRGVCKTCRSAQVAAYWREKYYPMHADRHKAAVTERRRRIRDQSQK
jgi:hypothetical protein